MDIRGVSRRFGAVALVLGPLALVAGSLFEVAGDDASVSTSLAKIARHQGEQRVLIVVDLIAGFMLPAMVYPMRLSHRGAVFIICHPLVMLVLGFALWRWRVVPAAIGQLSGRPATPTSCSASRTGGGTAATPTGSA